MFLSLMRHANAGQSERGSDFDRYLSQCGREESLSAGEFLMKYKIDKALVSYVKRTMQTFELVQSQTGMINADIVQDLYKNSDPEIIYDLLAEQENTHKHILVIGHNPLIYDIALMLANHNSPKRELLITTMMPPARIITMYFPKLDNWQDIGPQQGEIVEIFTPEVF